MLRNGIELALPESGREAMAQERTPRGDRPGVTLPTKKQPQGA